VISNSRKEKASNFRLHALLLVNRMHESSGISLCLVEMLEAIGAHPSMTMINVDFHDCKGVHMPVIGPKL
jgi:hypothetical protein